MKFWAGILGAPVAWAVEHLMGWGLTEASCDPGSRQWGVALTTWVAIVTAASATVAFSGLVAAVSTFRSVRGVGADDDPPPGRIWLMSICGMVISPIFLALILLSGIGALLLGHCHQG